MQAYPFYRPRRSRRWKWSRELFSESKLRTNDLIQPFFVLDGKNKEVNIEKMPKTHEELKNWVICKSREPKYLIHTDVAKDVQDIIAGGPVPTHIKPIWPFISFTAFNTLPKEFKTLYGVKESKLKNLILNFNLKLLKFTRPFLPPFFRLIAPARWASQRIKRNPTLKFKDKANF